jgi:hypothetical protein
VTTACILQPRLMRLFNIPTPPSSFLLVIDSSVIESVLLQYGFMADTDAGIARVPGDSVIQA